MYRYLHVDVFTSTRFEGNQLAVFPDPAGLSSAMMQTIAQEMAFSETTFVFPKEGAGDVRMRIFTPGDELPMAGHPTVGTTFALAAEGVIQAGRREFVFELGVGPTPVTLEWGDGVLEFVWMKQGLPEFGATIAAREALAAAVGVDARDLAAFPVQIVSCGVPFLFVPLLSRAAVDAVTVDRRAFKALFADAGLKEHPAFFFTTKQAADSDEATVYSRMLAPGFGVAEDPATGGASGPLGCYLLTHGLVSADSARHMLSLQGVAMRRPSRIHISIDSDDGKITRVRVGGTAIVVGRGELDVPSANR